MPFEIPDSWVWCRLDELFQFVRNGASISQTKGAGGLPITRIETISNGVLDKQRMGYADVDNDNYSQYYLQNRDILMSHINSPIHVGKSAICSDISSDEKIIHGMNLLCLRPLLSINAEYIHLYFRSEVFKQQISPYIQNAVNQASINIKNLSGVLCPIPPIDTQLRIVERCGIISILIENIEESLQ